MTERRMTLTMFMAAFGYANDAWRHPQSRTADIGSLAHVRDMAQAAERAGIDRLHREDRDDRHRIDDLVGTVHGGWDSWDRDAIIDDKAGGQWIDNDRVHDIDHVGAHFRVQGPTNIPRSPQDRPVLVQAGQSPAGIELGSTYADFIYAVQPEKAGAIAWYADYKKIVAAKGRDPERVKVLPGIIPIVGRTMSEAEEIAAELDECVTDTNGRALVSGLLDVDVSDLDVDELIPRNAWATARTGWSGGGCSARWRPNSLCAS